VKLYTTHLRGNEPPLLVREGFSWAAFFFGFLYLAVKLAWVPAALNLAALIGVLAIASRTGAGAPLLGLAVLQGLFGRDLWRWSLSLRGYAEGPVVAAEDTDAAFARLLGARPDLIPTEAGTTP
jgi:hypothetical protein